MDSMISRIDVLERLIKVKREFISCAEPTEELSKCLQALVVQVLPRGAVGQSLPLTLPSPKADLLSATGDLIDIDQTDNNPAPAESVAIAPSTPKCADFPVLPSPENVRYIRHFEKGKNGPEGISKTNDGSRQQISEGHTPFHADPGASFLGGHPTRDKEVVSDRVTDRSTDWQARPAILQRPSSKVTSSGSSDDRADSGSDSPTTRRTSIILEADTCQVTADGPLGSNVEQEKYHGNAQQSLRGTYIAANAITEAKAANIRATPPTSLDPRSKPYQPLSTLWSEAKREEENGRLKGSSPSCSPTRAKSISSNVKTRGKHLPPTIPNFQTHYCYKCNRRWDSGQQFRDHQKSCVPKERSKAESQSSWTTPTLHGGSSPPPIQKETLVCRRCRQEFDRRKLLHRHLLTCVPVESEKPVPVASIGNGW